MRKLLDHERRILTVLLPLQGGFLTKDVAERTPQFGGNRRQHSGATRSWLTILEKDGLVGRLDDLKPVVWCISAAGRAALAPNTTEGRSDRA